MEVLGDVGQAERHRGEVVGVQEDAAQGDEGDGKGLALLEGTAVDEVCDILGGAQDDPSAAGCSGVGNC